MPGLRVLLGSATPGAAQGGAKEQKAGCNPSPVSFIDSLICWTSVLFGRAECYSDIDPYFVINQKQLARPTVTFRL